MHKIMMAILTAGAVTALSTSSIAAQLQSEEAVSTPRVAAPSQSGEDVCIHAVGCEPTTGRQYDQCTNLAVERGWNIAENHDRGLNWFIYECLAGRIPE